MRGRALSPGTRPAPNDRPLCQNRGDPSAQMPMPGPDRSRPTLPSWLRRPNQWLIVPAAVLAGLLLFLVVWLVQRAPAEEEDAALLPAVTVEPAPEGTPLPAPQPPGLAQGEPSAEGEGGVFVLPDAPPQPPPVVAGETPPVAQADPGTGLPEAGTVAGADSQPVPIHRPAPNYPSRALRRGASGEVVVRALVGVDGQPRQVEVARSSSHRALDQAAVQAVRRWRFQPAMRDGQPVAQTVHVPFDFSP